MPLHPIVEEMWTTQLARGARPLCEFPVEEARILFSRARHVLGTGPAIQDISNFTIDGPSGQIPIRQYQPKGECIGLCVFLHGGGWVLGELDDFDALCQALAARSGCVVLSVDYRLAPEHPFPAALEDTLAAVKWAATEGVAALGLQADIVVAGDSAGGNLASVAAMTLGSDIPIKLQLLWNPVLDARRTSDSYKTFAKGYLLTAKDMGWFYEHYAGQANLEDPRISPALSPESHSVPAWIATAEYDVLRDEAEDFARELRKARVEAASVRYPGVMHGFARQFNHVDVADNAVSDAAWAVRQALQRKVS